MLGPEPDVDLLIVGAGVVGCAIAAATANARRSVIIVDRAATPASGVSSRNSGVLHGGLYYPLESRKARSCVRGNRLTVEWARKHGVPHAVPGKLVIARDDEELEALELAMRSFSPARPVWLSGCWLVPVSLSCVRFVR